MNNKNKIKYNGGAAMMVLVVFFVFISLTILIGIVSPTVREYRTITDNFKSKQTYFLAESGVEDVVYRLKNSKKTTGTETLVLGDLQAVTAITDIGGGKKKISTLGSTDTLERKIEVTLNTASGVSFSYGVQVGTGGVYLDSGAINGNVYSNGPITASSSGSNLISGTAISANSPSLIADQSNGTGIPAGNIIFGNTTNTQDVAQSFIVSTASPLNKVQLYIKKTGSPSNAVVKIMEDRNGSPGEHVFASGALLASTVTTSYGWVEVSFTANPILATSTTYWLVIDASASSSKYYTIGATSGNNYTSGLSKIGRIDETWSNTSPAGLDCFFNIYLGGLNGSISGVDQWNQLHIGTVSGSAQAHTVNAVNSGGNIYCQVGTNNNKACISQSDPVYISYPISDANIVDWQATATSGGTYTGDYNVNWAGATLGPKKIIGNLNVSGGGTLTITGTLWVTGNIVLNGGGLIKLASNYGTNDGVILSDGSIAISGGGHAAGSGTTGSYIMLLSLDNSSSAISVSGGAGAVVVYAPYGTVAISGGASLKEATGYRMTIVGGSSITYESGLTDNNFSSGPSGTWNIDSWKEVE
ncbi:MAG: choice-of-anchor R domain-containing protein [Candidatus Paceibacterota bacterium]